MGHWLDGLLDLGSGTGGITIQWDGVNMPERAILAFHAQFLATDDGPGNRTLISVRYVTAGGDVIGNTDDLRLVKMRGAVDSQRVAVFANALRWDPSVSAGSAEISLSDADAGALRVRHQSTTTAVFAASGAVIGNTAGIQQMLGGHRFTLRAMGSGAIDATTKDTIAWVDATGEHTVTLPPASVGRTLLLPFVGDNPPTLARAGAELINGIAGSYTMNGDADGGLTIAVSDGTNWVARTIREVTAGTTFLVGDVNGDTDANYISQITGSGGEVLVVADNFIFTTNGDAELKTTGEGDGAIEITHNGTRVVFAHDTTPEFGADYGLNRMRGGMRYTVRSVGSTTIDATTTDAVVWIDATGEHTVTLPPATAGRTLLLPFVGDNAPTLARAGSELINGVAANYDLLGDATGGLGIAISDGVNWTARTIGAAAAAGVDPSRLINTTAPLTGGGSLAADLTLGINPLGYVAPTRTISTTAPLTGGGALSANLTLGISSTAYVAPTRSISTTAPLTGGGTLAGDLTLAITSGAYVAGTRTINTTAPLTGGGVLSADLTLGINTTALAPTTRSIATTAPLTGGGDLSADRTLAVSDATTIAKGVVQLAGNLAGTAALPTVTGLKADTISIQTAAAVAKGSWTNTGLRIGDATAPTEALEVLGKGRFGSGASKVYCGGQVGLEATTSAIWMGAGTITPSTANYALQMDSTSFRVNAQGSTRVSFRAGNSILGEITGTGLRLSSDGGTPSRRLEVDGASNLQGQVIIGKSDNLVLHTLWGALSIANIRTLTASFTIDGTGGTRDLVFFCDTTSSGTITVTLPAVSVGRFLRVKRIAGTNNVLVVRSGTAVIEAPTFITCNLVTDPGGSNIHPYVDLMCDGTNWKIINHFSMSLQTS